MSAFLPAGAYLGESDINWPQAYNGILALGRGQAINGPDGYSYAAQLEIESAGQCHTAKRTPKMSSQGPDSQARTERWILHYTDKDGFNAIGSQTVWVFKAGQPPGNRPFGTYFTRLLPDDNKLAAGTRLPKVKREYVFAFEGEEGLEPVDGGKGDYNLWSDGDYVVVPMRQRHKGLAKELP